MVGKFLTMQDVVKLLRTSRAQIYRYMNDRDDPLVFFRLTECSRWLISEKDLSDWIKRNATMSLEERC